MRQDTVHYPLIKKYFTGMRRDLKEIANYELLQEGLSGAAIYRIELPEGAAILKITLVSANPIAQQRAQRELAFYQRLASHVPLHTPRILGAHSDQEGVALLMAMYQPSPPPAQWPATDYLEIARQLAQFHAAFWAKTEQLGHLSWLKPHQPEQITADIQQAYTYWQVLRAQSRFAEVLTGTDHAWIQRLLAQIQVVNNIIQSLPLTLCHGDCIPGNVLCDADGQFVWTDWQEVQLGCGPADISFFLQRASSDGATVPHAAAIATYHASLQEHLNQSLDLASIHRAVDASELWTRVLYWPAYLVHGPESVLADMIRQIRTLTEKLELNLK